MNMKKYCLLKDGSIERCYYGNGAPRDVYKEGKKWYIDHDVFIGCGIAYCHSEIVAFGDTIEELKEIKDKKYGKTPK